MITRINMMIAFVMALALGPVVANAVPVEWEVLNGGNGHFYEVVSVSPGTSWDDAKTLATEHVFGGAIGHLATITSAGEDDFIRDLSNGLDSVGGEVWLGGFQVECDPVDEACGWEWINGEGPFDYTNWTDVGGTEPNDSGGSESYLGTFLVGQNGWNDEGNFGNIRGIMIEYELNEAFVEPGQQVFFAGADDPDSPHGQTAGYQNVLQGGTVFINCCTVVDTRETSSGFLPVNFDIGSAIDTTAGCEALRVYDSDLFGSDKAVLRSWQRAVPEDKSVSLVGTELGVCLIQSEVISRGVVFSAENALNVVGYEMECDEPQIDFRPFTAGVSIDPVEIEGKFATRWSADCDGSRSGKRSSDLLKIMNVWHDPQQKASKPYLNGLAGVVLGTISQVVTADKFCVDNSAGFFDDIKGLVQNAKKKFGKNNQNQDAVDLLDDATRLALLIGEDAPDYDPYANEGTDCPDNPQGLLVGRLMALKFAACSELVHPTDSAASHDGNCVIADDIFDEMPKLPGFLNP